MIGKPDLTKFNDTIRGPRFNLVPMREDHQTIISQIVRDIEKTHGDIDQEGLHLDAVFKYQSERLFYLLIKMHAGGYSGYLELDDMDTDEPEIGYG